jgi:endonuclease YncB( thermonuclease family)
MLPRILQKAPLWGAFFVWAFGALAAQADCLPSGVGAWAQVSHVIDGDTLVLADGSKVRLIGVNTPELGYRGAEDEPFAALARQWVLQRVAGQKVRLIEGEQSRDRYGRVLAHVLDPGGMLLAQGLIAQGLGYALSIAPNSRLADCLFAREREARAGSRGLWRRGGVAEVVDIADGSAGFGVWRGRVSAVGQTARGSYLEIEDRVFLAMNARVVKTLAGGGPDGYRGRYVEFRGWLSDRSTDDKSLKSGYLRWFVQVNDARHLRLSDEPIWP